MKTLSRSPKQPRASRRDPSQRLFALMGLGIGLFAFLLNFLTPLVSDDWGRAASATSFGAVLDLSWDIYVGWDGRLINSILGNSSFLVPNYVFDFVNAIMFVALMFLIYAVAAPKGMRSPSLLLLAPILTWIFLPAFGQVTLWQLGSVIYLWAAVQMFVVIWLFQRYVARGDEPPWAPIPRAALLFVLGAVAGNAAQNGSAGAALILTGYVIASRRQRGRVPAWMLSAWVGTVVGLAAVVLAPGNSNREEALSSGGRSLLGILLYQLKALLARQYEQMGPLIILVAVLLAAYASMRRREWQRILTASLLIGGAFAATLVMLAAPPGAASYRTFSFGAFFLVAAAVVLVAGLVEAIGEPAVVLRRVLVTGLGVVAAYSAVPAVSDASIMWFADRARMSYVAEQRDAGDLDLVVDPLPVPQSKYRADFQLGDITTDPDRNRGFADYMGLNSVVVDD